VIQSPGGSQLTESLLLTALEMLYSILIPSHTPLPPSRCSATCNKSTCWLHAVLWTTCWRPGCCQNQRFASDLRCYVCSYLSISCCQDPLGKNMHYPALPYVAVFCCLTWVLQITCCLKNMQRRSQCFCLVSEAETWKAKDADPYMND